jgi:cytochrome c-type biogenesis protein CcmH/NrfG
VTCTSCGNSLPGAKVPTPTAKRKTASTKGQPAKQAPLTFFQSWKFIAMIGAVLVVAVILYKNYQPASPTAPAMQAPSMSPNAAAAVEQIENLQRVVDANPKDAENTLRLANMLHDVRMFPRAAAMYARYLELVPSNPDARVDLGTTYFELSMTDTTRQVEYLNSARTEMEKAITYAPRHQLAHFNLGIISLHAGNMEQANRWFSKCVAIDSTSEAAKRANQLLHQHTLTNTQ